MSKKILDIAQVTGDVFKPIGGPSVILLSGHTGGTWTLQVENPNGIWQDTAISFTAVGDQGFRLSPELSYRLSGGTVGAEAWLVTVNQQSRGG